MPSRTAVYGPVRTVVWRGSAGDRRPYGLVALRSIAGILPDAFRAVCRHCSPDLAGRPRVRGTTHEQMSVRWEADRFNLQPLDGRPPYPYIDDELRKVARDAYVSWHGSRYSVPWTYAGKQVWVRERGREIEVHHGRERIAIHSQAPRRHTVITQPEHHRGIPLGARQERKTLIHIQDTAPVVEVRPLASYESAAIGGVR